MAERNTIQKQLVLTAVKELHNHPTAEEVYVHIHEVHPTISKATVYRNLKQMSDNGHLKRIESVNQADHYDHQCHDHYHIQCSKCSRVFDVDLSYMTDLDERISDTNGFSIHSHDIVFKGICPDCGRKHS